MVNYNKIQETLKSKGLSQSFVSERIGMSRNYLKDCKRLNSDIPQDRLALIADLLGTTTEYLRDETDDPSPQQKKPAAISDELWEAMQNNPRAVALLEMLLKMSPEQMVAFEKVIGRKEG